MLEQGNGASVARDIFHSKGIRTLRWFLWKACWPSSVLLLLYPLYFFIVRSTTPFAHAFSHGDFLLLSLVLLLETALESEHLRHSKVWLEVVRQMSIWLALVLTVLFVASKFDIVVLLPSLSSPDQIGRMDVYAQMNCYAIISAVALGLIAYHAACDVEEELALQKATE